MIELQWRWSFSGNSYQVAFSALERSRDALYFGCLYVNGGVTEEMTVVSHIGTCWEGGEADVNPRHCEDFDGMRQKNTAYYCNCGIQCILGLTGYSWG